MAQAGYTPISLYYSTTASTAPSAGNLVSGELAINITDGKLYYKDNGGVVQLIASKAGASGDVVGPASATDNAIVRFDGTTGKLVQNSVVTIADTTGDISGVGQLNATTADLTNIEVTNIKAKDGTASASIADSTGVFTHSTTTVFPAGAVGTPSITTAGDLNTGIFFPAADTIAFAEGGAEAMRIDSDGDVGIGTGSPAYKLDVAGVISTNNNLTFTGTGNRITGDFSNATIANRVGFQTSTTNGATSVSILPNGTGTTALTTAFNNSDPTNASGMQVACLSTESRINSLITGTGSYLPMTFYTGGSERMRIDTSGNVGIGTSSPTYPLTVGDSTAPTGVPILSAMFSSNTAAGINLALRKSVDAANGTSLGLLKSRGTAASPTAVNSGDSIAAVNFVAYGGTNYRTLGQIVSTVDTYVSDTNISSYLSFLTSPSGSAAATERMRIDSSGNVSVGGTAARGTTAGSAAIQLFNGTAPVGTLTNGVSLYSASGDLRFMDASGNAYQVGFRNVPAVGTKTGSYTLATADVGKYVQVGSGGSITIPDATFAEGDAVSIFNNTSGNITITCSITTAYIAGTDSDKASVTLATRGVATVLFISSTVCVITGNVS